MMIKHQLFKIKEKPLILAFEWTTFTYREREILQLTLSGGADKVKEIVEDLVNGGFTKAIGKVKKLTHPKAHQGMACYTILVERSLKEQINLFHYLIQEHDETPNFVQITIDNSKPRRWLSPKNIVMNATFFMADLAVKEAKKRVKNEDKIIFWNQTIAKDIFTKNSQYNPPSLKQLNFFNPVMNQEIEDIEDIDRFDACIIF